MVPKVNWFGVVLVPNLVGTSSEAHLCQDNQPGDLHRDLLHAIHNAQSVELTHWANIFVLFIEEYNIIMNLERRSIHKK